MYETIIEKYNPFHRQAIKDGKATEVKKMDQETKKSRYDTIEEIEEVDKFNPFHDARGRFASANSYSSFTYKPGASRAHDLAIQRLKERTGSGAAGVGGGTGGGGKTKDTENEQEKPQTTSKPREFNGQTNEGYDEIMGTLREDKWEKSLNTDEYNAIMFYQFESGNHNAYLRSGEVPKENSLTKELYEYFGDVQEAAEFVSPNIRDDLSIPLKVSDSKKWLDGQIKNIDSAIDRSTIPEDMILYRGIKTPAIIESLGDPQKLVGSTITDKGYPSTTVDRATAEGYGALTDADVDGANKSVLLKITAKAGSKGAFISGMARDLEVPFGGGNFEVMLPRGSQFKITGVKQTANGKGWEVEAVYE